MASAKVETQQPAPKKHDSGAADLEKVTDYVQEESEVSEGVQDVIAALRANKTREAQERAERERQLAKIAIKKEDVELMVTEMEITKAVAERTLREHQGDVVAALTALVNM